MITRYSSRRKRLGQLLPDMLEGATAYDRIAGYFSSSILEVAGEAIEAMAPGAVVRVICNSELHPMDVQTAQAAKHAQYREWNAALPDDIPPKLKQRLGRLHRLLSEGRLQVRVLPDSRFGLVHGKAGIITRADGERVAFMGSANESKTAWEVNYEIVWTDQSSEGVAWVQEEFDALWNDPSAVELADTVIKEVERVSRRVVIAAIEDWKSQGDAEPASAAIELPLYRREIGLWAHQKHFVKLAFDQHKAGGARLVLADQVGLGKTIQLALAAKLMMLWGGGRVLALVPKPLLYQWRDELWDMLRLPSAVWTGRGWEDEQGVFHPRDGYDGLRKPPRRFALVSTGLITSPTPARDILSALTYECVILDEAHRARRSDFRDLGPTRQTNNLLSFIEKVAPLTKSMLLATATPVQLHAIEAWDLLYALNLGNDAVIGGKYSSSWRQKPIDGIEYVTGRQPPPSHPLDLWQWIRDPLPPGEEHRNFQLVRRGLDIAPEEHLASPTAYRDLSPADKSRISAFGDEFFRNHNPFLRHIVRRTREFLEEERDPTTGEPYLDKIEVRLFGEAESESLRLAGSLQSAYEAAEEFCEEVGHRPNINTGFLKTILLRRVGSTIIAGRKTAEKMLGREESVGDEDDPDEGDPPSKLYPLTPPEEEKLRRFLQHLQQAGEDPKYRQVEEILLQGVASTEPWIERGCIVFTQYYDSAWWVAEQLSQQLPDEPIGIYAGSGRSGIFRDGTFERLDREVIKRQVRTAEMRLVIGTDAASEGLNLQKLGSLINLDLPWNPTRLEQRKGRIQRIGQARDEVYVYNMRYRGSVEDRVHELLSTRLEGIRNLFGQIPDTLEDVWVKVALHQEDQARQEINKVPEQHPFEIKYDRIEQVDWESCAEVLDDQAQLDVLMRGW